MVIDKQSSQDCRAFHVAMIVIARCGTVALGVLGAATDAGPVPSLDDVRLMMWRIFRWIGK